MTIHFKGQAIACPMSVLISTDESTLVWKINQLMKNANVNKVKALKNENNKKFNNEMKIFIG